MLQYTVSVIVWLAVRFTLKREENEIHHFVYLQASAVLYSEQQGYCYFRKSKAGIPDSAWSDAWTENVVVHTLLLLTYILAVKTKKELKKKKQTLHIMNSTLRNKTMLHCESGQLQECSVHHPDCTASGFTSPHCLLSVNVFIFKRAYYPLTNHLAKIVDMETQPSLWTIMSCWEICRWNFKDVTLKGEKV